MTDNHSSGHTAAFSKKSSRSRANTHEHHISAEEAAKSTSEYLHVVESFDGATQSNGHPVPKHTKYPRLPAPSQARLDASLNEKPIDVATFDGRVLPCSSNLYPDEKKPSSGPQTVLYLAYGSNLCNETFRGVRGIKPLSQINVVVPSLKLTFDLPGIPYTEPCFANVTHRDPSTSPPTSPPTQPPYYHKDRWDKGMVGCVYEVTTTDYATIIATEGGGASYKDILVPCYPLSSSPTDPVPQNPTTKAFKAHTLFSPPTVPLARPDPAYAQPSLRYLTLLTTGSEELSLPTEYHEYLSQIRPYTITTTRQKIGKALFLAVWMPWLLFFVQLSKVLADDKGRVPNWLKVAVGWIFRGMWGGYDSVFRRAFGEGERTEGLKDEDEERGLLEGGYSDEVEVEVREKETGKKEGAEEKVGPFGVLDGDLGGFAGDGELTWCTFETDPDKEYKFPEFRFFDDEEFDVGK